MTTALSGMPHGSSPQSVSVSMGDPMRCPSQRVSVAYITQPYGRSRIHLVMSHFSPASTGAPPCKVSGST